MLLTFNVQKYNEKSKQARFLHKNMYFSFYCCPGKAPKVRENTDGGANPR